MNHNMPYVVVAVGLNCPASDFLAQQHGFQIEDKVATLHGRPVGKAQVASPSLHGEDIWRQPTTETILLTAGGLTFTNSWSKLSGILRCIGFLLEQGATGAQVLSTGRYPTNAQWLDLRDEAVCAVEDLARTVQPDQMIQARYSLMAALRDAFVSQFLSDGQDVYSCGMHNLGKPDVIVSQQASNRDSYQAAIRFEEYLLAEAPVGALQEGHTFATTGDAQRWRLTREPCSRFPANNPFYNPWGYWRLSPTDLAPSH